MAEADGPFLQTQLPGLVCRRAMEEERRRAAVGIAHNFNIGPIDPLPPDAGAERFGHRFLGSKTGGKRLDTLPAILPFGSRIDAFQETGAVLVNGAFDACNLNQIYTSS
jgi:hypothetical protein